MVFQGKKGEGRQGDRDGRKGDGRQAGRWEKRRQIVRRETGREMGHRETGDRDTKRQGHRETGDRQEDGIQAGRRETVSTFSRKMKSRSPICNQEKQRSRHTNSMDVKHFNSMWC